MHTISGITNGPVMMPSYVLNESKSTLFNKIIGLNDATIVSNIPIVYDNTSVI